MVASSKVAYDVGCAMIDVINWWQERAAAGTQPAVHELRVGYDYFGGPSISAHWVDKKTGKDGCNYVSCSALGSLRGDVIVGLLQRSIDEWVKREKQPEKADSSRSASVSDNVTQAEREKLDRQDVIDEAIVERSMGDE